MGSPHVHRQALYQWSHPSSSVFGFRMNFSAFDGTPEKRWLREWLVRDMHGAKMPECLDSDDSKSVLMEQELGQLHFSHGNSVWVNSHPFQRSVQTRGGVGLEKPSRLRELLPSQLLLFHSFLPL